MNGEQAWYRIGDQRYKRKNRRHKRENCRRQTWMDSPHTSRADTPETYHIITPGGRSAPHTAVTQQLHGGYRGYTAITKMMMMIWALGRRNKDVIWRPCGYKNAHRLDSTGATTELSAPESHC